MDTDETSAGNPTRRCCLCHRILSSEIETRRALASTSICNNCNLLFFNERTRLNNSLESVENMLSQQILDFQPTILDHVNQSRQRHGDIFSYAAYESDSDASVDVNDDDDDGDDDGDEIEVVENMGESLVGRIQLHRSLATNGRNRPNDWLSAILSNEVIQNSERRLFGILEEQVLETSGYAEYVDVGTHGSRLDAPPTAVWFMKNLECVAVDEPGLVCVICKDNVCVGSVVNRLPCCHVYHPSCIVPWLKNRNTCPLCRYELPTGDMDRSHQEPELQGALAVSGRGRRWFVVAPLVSVVGIVVMWWLGGRRIWWSKG
ncbi:hypothetical protein R6Q59_027137 [Mikania micrantha]|uniref:RING-type E3 ubiquitin transferase n=1 Tax=Mikania micrantha TaxID=192012 RepID=A0A5N6L8P3_9ASTR|nr:hypothetical protein E3N88_45598 [Mikania micrantha]